MSSPRIGSFAQAWYKWKSLRLPWRKRFLVGYDLRGNTYWEFRLTQRGPSDNTTAPTERWRRIVKYPRSTHHSQVRVSPQWHQWLRHTRHDPPSLGEQSEDVSRQARMKYLAAQADARWEAKPRIAGATPDKGQRLPALDTGGAKEEAARIEQRAEDEKKATVDKNDPWEKAKARAPGEKWQPESWTPTGTKNRS